MTLVHEHILACERCNGPLLISKLDTSSSSPQRTANTRLVLTYEQTVAAILEGQAAVPSFLCEMREDTADAPGAQRYMAPSMTCLHVLNMEGFEKPTMRRDFAIHCALDADILESQFMAISRLVGADVGACWCECHAEQQPIKKLGDAHGDGWMPLTLAPVVERGGQRDAGLFTDCQEKTYQSRRRKRRKRSNLTEGKRWPWLLGPLWKKETDV